MENERYTYNNIVFNRFDTVEIESKNNFKHRGFLIFLGYKTPSGFVNVTQISKREKFTTITTIYQVIPKLCKLVLFEKSH